MPVPVKVDRKTGGRISVMASWVHVPHPRVKVRTISGPVVQLRLTTDDDVSMGSRTGTELRRVAWRVHHALEDLPLGRFSVRGNDGLTKTERDADAARYEATGGNPAVPGMTPEQWSAFLDAALKPQPLPIRH